MRVGIDASPLYMRKSGISSYLESLLQAFEERKDGHTFFLYSNRPLPPGRFETPPFQRRLVRLPLPRLQAWFQLGLPLRMARDSIDVFLGVFHRLPLLATVPTVLVVHDLSGLLMRGLHTGHVVARDSLMPLFVRKASRILSVSEFTAGEVVRRFPSARGRVDVAPEAAASNMVPVDDPARCREVRRRLSLPRRYILFLGTLEPRKNLPGLIRAYASVADRMEQDLVLAGSMGWKSSELRRILGDSPVGDRVHLTGFVEDDDLPVLISMADLMAYPALYEGFGLPVVEAMACGTAVLTSSVSSLPEAAGGAAHLVDPTREEDIAGGLLRLAADPEMRADLERRGLKRVRGLSWSATAGLTLESCRRAVHESRG